MDMWQLWGRKIVGTPYGGTWQPRRSGTLAECTAEMHEQGTGRFDRFWLAQGSWEGHERPPGMT